VKVIIFIYLIYLRLCLPNDTDCIYRFFGRSAHMHCALLSAFYCSHLMLDLLGVGYVEHPWIRTHRICLIWLFPKLTSPLRVTRFESNEGIKTVSKKAWWLYREDTIWHVSRLRKTLAQLFFYFRNKFTLLFAHSSIPKNTTQIPQTQPRLFANFYLPTQIPPCLAIWRLIPCLRLKLNKRQPGSLHKGPRDIRRKLPLPPESHQAQPGFSHMLSELRPSSPTWSLPGISFGSPRRMRLTFERVTLVTPHWFPGRHPDRSWAKYNTGWRPWPWRPPSIIELDVFTRLFQPNL